MLESASPLGVVVHGEGSLPFSLIHGESLISCAAFALEEAGVQLVEWTAPWESIVEIDEPFVVHDALCPMTPPSFVARCIAASLDGGRIVAGVRPVTDTVKTVHGGLIGDTLDRDGLLVVTSPVVIPPALLADFDEVPVGDLLALVVELAATHDVVTLEAPSEGRRLATPDDVTVLEALTLPQQP